MYLRGTGITKIYIQDIFVIHKISWIYIRDILGLYTRYLRYNDGITMIDTQSIFTRDNLVLS